MRLLVFILYVCVCGLALPAGSFFSVLDRNGTLDIVEGKHLDVALAWGIFDDQV
jgi:hypothetical protein